LLGGAALGFLTMVGLWLDFNRTAASLAYVIVLTKESRQESRASDPARLPQLPRDRHHLYLLNGGLLEYAQQVRCAPFRTATCGSSREQRRVFPWKG
jgi:hypothetical protein